MTDTLTDIEKRTLTTEEVRQWLLHNPGFFQNNPDILELMTPPAETKGRKVADFQSYMIKRLREDKLEALASNQELVETSRANMHNQERIHEAIIRLLDSESLDELLFTITMDFPSLLGVDIAALVVESNGHEIPHIHVSGVRVVPSGTIERWMEGQKVLIESDIAGIEAIYGGGAGLVKSQILLSLNIAGDTPPALIAFGSRNPTLFHEGLGTSQIQFLAGVIQRCLRLRLFSF